VDWVKLATRYYTDPKVRGLDDAAELMFVRGLARAGELGDGGFIPESDVSLLARRRRHETLVEQLVVSRLWSRVDGGYRINAWADWQSAADALAVRRAADRERQRKRRAAADPLSRDNGNLSRDVTVTEEEEERDLGGTSTGVTHSRAREGLEPPSRCEKHLKIKDPPKCGGCADARKAHNRWQVDRAKRLSSLPKCRLHKGEPADNCGRCRSEELSPA
jgi:hypothetical protein